MNEELKPCPFCGGKAIREHNESMVWEHFIFCDTCHVEMAFETTKEATAAWNRRVSND